MNQTYRHSSYRLEAYLHKISKEIIFPEAFHKIDIFKNIGSFMVTETKTFGVNSESSFYLFPHAQTIRKSVNLFQNIFRTW